MRAILLSLLFLSSLVTLAQSKPTPAPELNKEQVLGELKKQELKQAGMDKKQAYILLEKAADILKEGYSQEFLLQVLPFYITFNKFDQTHFYVEMFVEIYQKHTKEFSAALDKALPAAQKEEFMRKLKLAMTEAQEGNG